MVAALFFAQGSYSLKECLLFLNQLRWGKGLNKGLRLHTDKQKSFNAKSHTI